jgi:hypothetical protein
MPETSTSTGESTAAGTSPDGGIDVVKLADKVYRLMLAEARLAIARSERLPKHTARPGARYE